MRADYALTCAPRQGELSGIPALARARDPGHSDVIMFRRLALISLAIAAVGWGAAGAESDRPPERSEVTVETGEGHRHRFLVEVARTQQQLAVGLMFRRQLAEDAGMLFDFGVERPVSMWMKNTLLPLDMIFIRGDGRIANVAERTVPGSLQPHSSKGPVRGVLEVNGGTVERLGIKAGDRVIHGIFDGR